MARATTDIEMAVSCEEEDRLLDTEEGEEDWDMVGLKPRHTIFLSYSGAQKNFVEQLCEDLVRANQAPFFDKRPDSLPKGEKFAQLILQAAQQCELGIVVVSEDYFSRSKWPMLELAAFVQARNCKILPLFLGLTCKEFGELERRQGWFRRWDERAQADRRIRVDVWKEALSELDGRNGMEYAEALGEVAYRTEVVATACSIVHVKSLQDEVLPPMWRDPLVPAMKSLCLSLILVSVKFICIIVFKTCFLIRIVFIMVKLVSPCY